MRHKRLIENALGIALSIPWDSRLGMPCCRQLVASQIEHTRAVRALVAILETRNAAKGALRWSRSTPPQDFDADRSSPQIPGGDQCRAAAGKRIDDAIVCRGVVSDEPRDRT